MIDEPKSDERGSRDLLESTGRIVLAYLANNAVPQTEVPIVIKDVHAALVSLASGIVAETSHKPAVPVKKSVTAEYLVCLEDGQRLKMLKRYLRSRYNLAPDDYRRKWGLPADYPMVAPNYAARRSEFAKQSGLGRTPKANKKRKRA